MKISRADDSFDLPGVARADDRAGDRGIAQRPGDRDLPGRTSMAFADFRSRSTRARFFESFGSWNSRSRLRQSLSGRLAARSRVIAPVNKPEAIGE